WPAAFPSEPPRVNPIRPLARALPEATDGSAAAGGGGPPGGAVRRVRGDAGRGARADGVHLPGLLHAAGAPAGAHAPSAAEAPPRAARPAAFGTRLTPRAYRGGKAPVWVLRGDARRAAGLVPLRLPGLHLLAPPPAAAALCLPLPSPRRGTTSPWRPPSRLPCGDRGAMLSVPMGLARFGCPICSAELDLLGVFVGIAKFVTG
ncbi:unnamed protein product, partial [Urochloa humidicola]